MIISVLSYLIQKDKEIILKHILNQPFRRWAFCSSFPLTLLFAPALHAESADPAIDKALAFQQVVNNGQFAKAADFWTEEKAQRFERDDFDFMERFFKGIELQKSQLESQCTPDACRVMAEYTGKDGEPRLITYHFQSASELQLTSVQTKPL